MNYYPELIPTAVKMIGALAIVLLGLLTVLYVIKKVSQGRVTGSGNRLINVLETNYIGDKKNITMIEIPGEILVLGISSDHIRLLSKIENPETVNKIKNRAGDTPGNTFMEHLQKFTSKIRTSGREEGDNGKKFD